MFGAIKPKSVIELVAITSKQNTVQRYMIVFVGAVTISWKIITNEIQTFLIF